MKRPFKVAYCLYGEVEVTAKDQHEANMRTHTMSRSLLAEITRRSDVEVLDVEEEKPEKSEARA